MRLPPMLLQPVRGSAVVLLRLGTVGDEFGLARLTEEDAVLDRRGRDGCSVRLVCRGGSLLQIVLGTAGARARGGATILDGASALDSRSIAVVRKGVAVVVVLLSSWSASTRVRFGIAIQATESVAIVDGRCGRSVAGSEIGSIDSLAAGGGRVWRRSDEADVHRSRRIGMRVPVVVHTTIHWTGFDMSWINIQTRGSAARKSTSSPQHMVIWGNSSCRCAYARLLLTD